jgi:acetyl-CoA acyltransferase
MVAMEHTARAVICGEGDIYIATGVENVQHDPMAFAARLPGLSGPMIFSSILPC